MATLRAVPSAQALCWGGPESPRARSAQASPTLVGRRRGFLPCSMRDEPVPGEDRTFQDEGPSSAGSRAPANRRLSRGTAAGLPLHGQTRPGRQTAAEPLRPVPAPHRSRERRQGTRALSAVVQPPEEGRSQIQRRAQRVRDCTRWPPSDLTLTAVVRAEDARWLAGWRVYSLDPTASPTRATGSAV